MGVEGGTSRHCATYTYIYIYICHYIFICLSINLPIYIFLYLSIGVYRSISLSFYLSISLSLYLSFYLSICLSIYLPIYLSISLSIYLSIYLSVYLFIYLSVSIDLSFYLSIYLSLYLSFYLSICVSIYLSIFLSFYLSIYLSLYLSVYLSIYLSIFSIGSMRGVKWSTYGSFRYGKSLPSHEIQAALKRKCKSNRTWLVKGPEDIHWKAHKSFHSGVSLSHPGRETLVQNLGGPCLWWIQQHHSASFCFSDKAFLAPKLWRIQSVVRRRPLARTPAVICLRRPVISGLN